MKLAPPAGRSGGIHGGSRVYDEDTGLYYYVKMTSTREFVAERLGMHIGRDLGLTMHEISEATESQYAELKRIGMKRFGKYDGSEDRVQRKIATFSVWGGKPVGQCADRTIKRVKGLDDALAGQLALDIVIRNSDRHGLNAVLYRNCYIPIDHAFGLHNGRDGLQTVSLHSDRVKLDGDLGWAYIEKVHDAIRMVTMWQNVADWSSLLRVEGQSASIPLEAKDEDQMVDILSDAPKRARAAMGELLLHRFEWEKGKNRL